MSRKIFDKLERVVWNRVKYYIKHNCDKKSKLLFPDNDS